MRRLVPMNSAALLVALAFQVCSVHAEPLTFDAGSFHTLGACLAVLHDHGVRGVYVDPRVRGRQVYIPAGAYSPDQFVSLIAAATGIQLRRVGPLVNLPPYSDGAAAALRKAKKAARQREPEDSVQALATARKVLGWLNLDKELVIRSGFSAAWFSRGHTSRWSEFDAAQRARLEAILSRMLREKRLLSAVEPNPARRAVTEEDRAEARRRLADNRLTVRFLTKYELALAALAPAPLPSLPIAHDHMKNQRGQSHLYVPRVCLSVPLW